MWGDGVVIAEELRGEIQMYDYENSCWAKVADISSDGDSGKPRNVLSASVKQQCCADGAFEIGGVYAATMSMTVRLPGLTRYQIKGARALFQTRFDGGEWIDRGTFYITDAQRTADVFTLSGQDAMGWCDTSSFVLSINNNLNSFGEMIQTGTGATLDYWLGHIIIPKLNELIGAQTGISNMLTWHDYDSVTNGHYCNQMRWGDTYADGPTNDPSNFFLYEGDGVFSSDNPRDFLRWCAELAGGFITARNSGDLTLRQFWMTELGTTTVYMADLEPDGEVADYMIYVHLAGTIFGDGVTSAAIGGNPAHGAVNIRYTVQANPFLSGYPYIVDHRFSPVFNLWNSAGKFTARPFHVTVHKAEQYELGQKIHFPDWHDIGETQTHTFDSVITGIEWTFRGGTRLSCGGEDSRVMADCIRATKADKAIRELRSRFQA